MERRGDDATMHDEWAEHLGAIGVGPSAIRAYLELRESGTRVSPEDVPDLMRAHLVTSDGREALPIRAATSAWIAAQRIELLATEARARALSRASRAHSGHDVGADFIDVVSGLDTVRGIFEETHRSAQNEVRMFDRPPFLSSADAIEVEPSQSDVMGRGVAYRVVYLTSLAQDRATYEVIANSVAMGEEARLTPNLPLRMLLIDDTHALVVLPHRAAVDPDASEAGLNVDALIVHPSTLLDALQELFESTWAHSLPFVADDGSAAWSIDPVDRRILALMNTGLTDQRIGQVVGLSERTVARRINRLQEQLSVVGRFALGVAASRDGLL